MKVNSENLYKYINDLATDEKVKFKVYYDDNYVTQVYWNGESFEWDTGTFTSGAFFNPLYDFEVIEEDKKIDYIYHCAMEPSSEETKFLIQNINDLADKINEIIDYINEGINE